MAILCVVLRFTRESLILHYYKPLRLYCNYFRIRLDTQTLKAYTCKCECNCNKIFWEDI